MYGKPLKAKKLIYEGFMKKVCRTTKSVLYSYSECHEVHTVK